MTIRRIAALLAIALLMAGCSGDELVGPRMPTCGEPGARTTFLMAQSVPEARLVPCIDAGALPGNLAMERIRIDSSSTQLRFVGDWPDDEDLPVRLAVRFSPSCDTSGAVAVPTDEPGTRRLERVQRLTSGYTGARFYVFDGGCVAFRFDARGEGWLNFVHGASRAWTFMPRTEVERLRDLAFEGCDRDRAAARSCER